MSDAPQADSPAPDSSLGPALEPPKGPGVVALSILALLLPFFFLNWLTPGLGESQISMDYPRVSGPQQQELLFSIVHGSFPLFVPGFAGGQSAGALTAGQLYHPLTYFAALAPGYWDGGAQAVNTLLRILSLGLVNLLLYRWLRRLVRGEWVALALATVTVFNLRMLNVFHGAAALEGFTGHLFTVAALGWCWLTPARWMPRIGVVVGTYCTVVSGHPQFAYFSLLGTVLAALLMPDLVQGARTGRGPGMAQRARYWAHMVFLAGLGGSMAAAYALPFQLDFMSSNMRVGRAYEFSLWWGDTLTGALNNFFQPLQVATSVAFGGSVATLLAALAPLLALFGVKLPRFTWAAWVGLLVTFLHALGDVTPVHWFFWKFLPLFGSVRGPGRLTVIVPFLVLAILVGVFRAKRAPRGPCSRFAPTTLLAALGAVSALAHWALPGTEGTMDNTPATFNSVAASTELALFGWGLGALAALGAYGQLRVGERRGPIAVAAALLFVALVAQTRISLRNGIWTEDQTAFPTLEDMREDKRERLTFRGSPGGGLYSEAILNRLEHSCLDPILARLYVKHLTASDNEAAWALMDAGRPRDAVVLEFDPLGAGAAEAPASAGGAWSDERLELTYASFNRVSFDATAPMGGWLELTFPFSPNWRATIDGEAAAIARANGAYQAVRVPAGDSVVEFRYVSRAAELGMLASCLGLLACGVWLAFGALRGGPRWICLAVFTGLSAGGFGWWRAGLHAGEHIGTEYLWTPPAADARPNLAWQRPNQMSPIYPLTWNDTQATGRTPDTWGSGNAVDGLREPGRGFRTLVEQDAHWTVDLAGSPLVDEVVVYGGRIGPEPGASLSIELWDGEAWVKVAGTDQVDRELERFRFPAQTASRVRLQARGTPALAADEVEVYGPGR